jgi:hypothetical protein
MLNLKFSSHVELGALLDLERLVLKGVLGAWSTKVNGDRWTALALHGQGQNNADAGIVGVRDRLATTEAQRLLVTLKRLIIGICFKARY